MPCFLGVHSVDDNERQRARQLRAAAARAARQQPRRARHLVRRLRLPRRCARHQHQWRRRCG